MNITHGKRYTPEYRAWDGMKTRCFNPKANSYHNYGGRGITVCDRWINSFENFFTDLGPRPTPKHSLERNNVDGDYNPSNCRWATLFDQQRNQRTNRWLIHKDKRMILSDWAIELNTSIQRITYHLKTKSLSETINYLTNKQKNQ